MTIEDIQNLQIGDKIAFANGREATVRANYVSNEAIGLDMSGGDTMIGFTTEQIPPDKQDSATTVTCPWADLITATKIQ